ARGAAWSLPLSIGSENGRQAARPCFARRPVALHHEDHMPTHGYEPTREAAMGSHQRRARRCRLQLHPAPALAQHPLLGDANNTIFISKIFSQKIWPKNWGGSSNRKFREWFVCGSGPAPPRPPFVQMKNTRGVFLFAGIPAAFQRRAPKSRISARAG